MLKNKYPQVLWPPSERYPTWKGAPDDPVVYLGWGERDFQRKGIPVHCNPGWVCWILTEGSVNLQTDQGLRSIEAGDALICGPEFPFGFPLQSKPPGSVLIWIWRNAPPNRLLSEKDDCKFLRFSQDQIKLIQALHEQVRIEVFEKSPMKEQVLHSIRALLFALFQREMDSPESGQIDNRIRTARCWMINNLSCKNPVNLLARYLDLSPMTLHRLFVRETGEAPGAYFQRMKMERCAQLLQLEGFSIKRVAYEMGYSYPQDFSRAYKGFFGVPPIHHHVPSPARAQHESS